jgi:hypothetical protein
VHPQEGVDRLWRASLDGRAMARPAATHETPSVLLDVETRAVRHYAH